MLTQTLLAVVLLQGQAELKDNIRNHISSGCSCLQASVSIVAQVAAAQEVTLRFI